MSVYEDRKDALEEYEFRMGLERGRLAVTLDLLTDALVLVGQHGVYCQSVRQAGMPAMDIQMISHSLTGAKELIASVMAEIQRKKSEAGEKRPVRKGRLKKDCVASRGRWWCWGHDPAQRSRSQEAATIGP